MKLAWRPAARADRMAIYDYIDADNPKAVIEVDQQISQQIARLADHPESGRHGRVTGTREFVITPYPYIVVYRVVGQTVQILRLLYQRQRWPQRERL